MTERITVNASLVDPKDSTEVNLVAAAVGVGTTNRLASGQKIKWTADFLRANVGSFVGKPINVMITEMPKGKTTATGHTRKVVGAIKDAIFDEERQEAIVTGSLWPHYFPKTVSQIRDLYKHKDLNVSMEFSYEPGTLQANEDGSESPTQGGFSGMGIVDKPGDPRSMVYLLAALKDDEAQAQEVSAVSVVKELISRLKKSFDLEEAEAESEEEEEETETTGALAHEAEAAHEGSYEWIRRAIQDHLVAASGGMAYCEVIATYSNYAIYKDGDDYFRIDFKRSGGQLNFGEPQAVDPVYQPTAKASTEEGGDTPVDDTGTLNQGEISNMTPEEAQAAKDEIAQLQASLNDANKTLADMKAAQDARDAEDSANKRADERMAEVEKILPVKEDLKAGLRESLKTLDDAAYEVLKANFASAKTIAAGIAPGDEIENPDPTPGTKDSQEVPEAAMKQFQAEAMAWSGQANKSEDKE